MTLKLLLFIAFTTAMLESAHAGTTCDPQYCCQTEPGAAGKLYDTCTTAGTFKSKSKCYLKDEHKIDRCDYYQCARCGSTWCMARLMCPQPCFVYKVKGLCDCWNYYDESTGTCTNMPQANKKPLDPTTQCSPP